MEKFLEKMMDELNKEPDNIEEISGWSLEEIEIDPERFVAFTLEVANRYE